MKKPEFKNVIIMSLRGLCAKLYKTSFQSNEVAFLCVKVGVAILGEIK